MTGCPVTGSGYVYMKPAPPAVPAGRFSIFMKKIPKLLKFLKGKMGRKSLQSPKNVIHYILYENPEAAPCLPGVARVCPDIASCL